MDEFGSPLAGGIRAVRRNISSSFLGAPRQAQADPVTTNLLQQQSLSLTSISQQLQGISGQIKSFDFSLQGVKENLAISDQLERQRAVANQNRERILAEQGLREGKESALENKIQSSLTQPLQRVGVKTQGVLGRLQNFFLILAGGWLTKTGIDLLQSLSEGNVDKINELKTKFIGGLTIIAGTLTALTLGIKNTLRILGLFVSNVARVAFGGLLRVSLNGVRILLAGLVKKAAGLGAGALVGGGIGATVRTFAELFAFDRITKFIGNIFRKNKIVSASTQAVSASSRFFNPGTMKGLKGANPLSTPLLTGSEQAKNLKPSGNIIQKGFRNISKKFGSLKKAVINAGGKGTVGAMKNPARVGIRGLINKIPGKGAVGKLLTMLGLKGGAKVLAGRLLGPLGTFVTSLIRGDGIGKALASTAGYAAAAAATAKLLAPMLALPIPGARILYGILVLAGGIAGQEAIRKLYDGILGLFGFGKNKDKDKNKVKDANVKTSGGGLEVRESERTYTKAEIDALNAGASMDAAGNVVPINKNGDKATQISEVEEDKPEIITLPMGGATGGMQGGGAPAQKTSNSIPTIQFDKNNPHTLYATSVTGAGN